MKFGVADVDRLAQTAAEPLDTGLDDVAICGLDDQGQEGFIQLPQVPGEALALFLGGRMR